VCPIAPHVGDLGMECQDAPRFASALRHRQIVFEGACERRSAPRAAGKKHTKPAPPP
jgi:hypothetical protein